MNNILTHSFIELGLSAAAAQAVAYSAILAAVLFVAALFTWLVRTILLNAVTRLIQSNHLPWDDALIKHRFFYKISWFVPIVVLYLAQDLILPAETVTAVFLRRLFLCAIAVVTVRGIVSLLNSINDIYRISRRDKLTSIRGYIDAAKIIAYIFGAIFILAILTNRSPWGLLSIIGGLTAVIMLVFKDTILGFVASIQLSGTDMVRIGDWIQMPAYNADGDVIDISIHCVRVQNWDKTITTIPTYALIANPFINWRGMSESGGRRIKRALHIDMQSISFVDGPLLKELGRISLISDYLRERQQEIDQYNRQCGADDTMIINGRRQTNIGIFRAYVIAYLKQHPKIHQEMTFLVRHLEPGPNGLPLQIYVFSRDQVWARYEEIQADIFDHLLAALPVFGLRVFQNPSGRDFHALAGQQQEKNSSGLQPEVHGKIGHAS